MLKRTFDLVLASAGLVILSPLLAATGLAVYAIFGPPVLFRQARAGLRGRAFDLVKFRTMREAFAADGRPLPDADRATPFGRWLRRSSLDELPELWNVVRGDMSLVGPRPLFVRYLPRYDARQARRHEVRPGITGLAQVSGRNLLTWADKLELDVVYVESRSFGLDVRILVRTLWQVLRRSGINQPGHETAQEFFGTDSSRC